MNDLVLTLPGDALDTLASANGLPFTGTMGLLAEAKARGLVDALAPLIQELRVSARFWISSELERRILKDADEPPS